MVFQKNDFIEIEFTGKTKEGEIFDSNIKEDLKKLHQGHDHEIQAKPFIFCIGQGMFLKSVEDFLIGKDLGSYNLDLGPEKAFGKRLPNLVQMVPSKFFREQKLNPFPGATFNFDGRVGKVLTVSGGRVMVDFNNPLAGKDVSYQIKVLKKVDDLNEQIKSFIEFLFRKDFKFEVKEKTITIFADPKLVKFIELFSEKFKEIFNLELKVEEIKEKEEKVEEIEEKKEKNESKARA